MNRIATLAQPVLVPAVVGLSIAVQLGALAVVKLLNLVPTRAALTAAPATA